MDKNKIFAEFLELNNGNIGEAIATILMANANVHERLLAIEERLEPKPGIDPRAENSNG